MNEREAWKVEMQSPGIRDIPLSRFSKHTHMCTLKRARTHTHTHTNALPYTHTHTYSKFAKLLLRTISFLSASAENKMRAQTQTQAQTEAHLQQVCWPSATHNPLFVCFSTTQFSNFATILVRSVTLIYSTNSVGPFAQISRPVNCPDNTENQVIDTRLYDRASILTKKSLL